MICCGVETDRTAAEDAQTNGDMPSRITTVAIQCVATQLL